MFSATLNNQRTSPRKVRLVADLIKGKPALFALDLLSVTPKRAADPIAKLLQSAIANAKMQGASADALVVSNCRVDVGKVLKRSMPRARGSAFPIKKRTSKVILTLDIAQPKIEAKKKTSVKTK